VTRGTVLGLAAVAGLVLALAAGGVARGDLGEDHLQDWKADPGAQEGLQQGLITGTVITACSDGDFVSSTQAAVDRWNSAVARTIFQHYCNYPQVWVSTANFYTDCQSVPGSGFPHACVRPTSVSGEQIVNPTYVRMNPDLFPGEGEWADGGAHTSHDVTHEFGHVLGHADYDFGQYGSCQFDTIMDTWERCWYVHDPRIVTPQALDVTNYNDAYKPNGVASFTGWSPGIGQVQLSWDPSNVHAEAIFRVNRWPVGQGCCGTEAGTAAKNASGITLYNQPSGSQTYRVRGWTYALNNGYGDNPSPGDVTVNVCGAGDSDCDGFTNAVEQYLGTDPYDNCPDNSSDDAWPLDMNKDRDISFSFDVISYRGNIGKTVAQYPGVRRLDLNADGDISFSFDVMQYRGQIGKTCT